MSPFQTTDCRRASGWPDPPGDPLPDVAGVCRPAAEGDAAGASGQGENRVAAPKRFWHKNQEGPPSETHQAPDKRTHSVDWFQYEHIQL